MAFPFKGFNADQGIFLSTVSAHTGIDPTVILAWMGQEGAFSGKETGAYNYLNIMGPNGPVSFSNAGAAAMATIAFLQGSNYNAVMHVAQTKPTPREQINAIAASPFDKAHYGGQGGPDLINTYESYFGKGSADHAYHSPTWSATLIRSAEGSQGAQTGGALPVTGPSVGFTNPFGSILDFFNHLWDIRDRIGFIIAGAIIVILAIVLIGKQQTSNTFTFSKGGE